MCKSKTILTQERWIHSCSRASHLHHTQHMCIQKFLKETFLRRWKRIWKFPVPTDLHALCSFAGFMVRGSITSFFFMAFHISDHISELPKGLISFLVQPWRSNFSIAQSSFSYVLYQSTKQLRNRTELCLQTFHLARLLLALKNLHFLSIN